MNLLTNKISFFILIILFFGFFSCQDKTKELGLSLPNQKNVEVFFTDTMTVETSTVFIDSVNTTNSTSLLVGKLNDPQLGVMTASSILTFQAISSERFKPIEDTLASVDISVGNSLVEASLVLNYSKSYGEGTGKQKFGVHTLVNNLDKSKVYNNKSGLPTDNFDEYNPISIDKTTTGHEFDIATDLPGKRLRIPLSDSFRDKLIIMLKSVPDDGILTQDLLETYLKGIVLVPDAASKTILDFEATAGSGNVSKLGFIELRCPVRGKTDVFYSYIITVKQPDLLSVYNARAPSVRYNKITVVRTGTPPFSTLPITGNATIAPIGPDNLCIAQTGLGYYTKITFPKLKYWIEKEKMSVNRVDLVVFPAENSYDEKMVLPNGLELVELDANGNRSKLTVNRVANTFTFTDNIIRIVQAEGENPYALSRPLTLGFLSVGGYYSGNMTTYFQYMLNELNPNYTASAKKVNNGFLLGVTQASEPLRTATTSSPVSLDRLILRGANAPTKSLKLRVFYTKNK